MQTTRLFAAIAALSLLAACTPAATDDQAMQGMDHSSMAGMDHSMHSESGSTTMTAAGRLQQSPRHGEWVEVKSGSKTVYTWVVYPQTTGKVPVVLVIHENKGLNDWARAMADEVAEAGYIAVAPDLLSGFSAEQARTSDFATPDDATKAIGQLKPEAVQADLAAVTAWAETIPSSNGKLASAGFCWGGSQSFTLATKSDALDVAMVFYGTGPTDAAAYSAVKAPVEGFYGGADERVNATIDGSEKAMKAAGKTYNYEIYKGAGHAFMRLGEEPNASAENATARDEAFARMKEILGSL